MRQPALWRVGWDAAAGRARGMLCGMQRCWLVVVSLSQPRRRRSAGTRVTSMLHEVAEHDAERGGQIKANMLGFGSFFFPQ